MFNYIIRKVVHRLFTAMSMDMYPAVDFRICKQEKKRL